MLVAHAVGESKRRDRFEQRKEWSTEETGLLTRHDRNRSLVAQCGRRCECLGRRSAPRLLRREHFGYCLTIAAVLLGSSNGVSPRSGIGRVTGVKI
jgi:hypothetical protein